MKTVNMSFTILELVDLEDDVNIDEVVEKMREDIDDVLFTLPGTLAVNDIEYSVVAYEKIGIQ